MPLTELLPKLDPSEPRPVRAAEQRFYHPELDILRFFASFMVFLHHSLPHEPAQYVAIGLPEWIGVIVGHISKAGAFGVDLFFVLSSYLITELLLREKQNFGRVDVKAFYLRRMLRIWPLYFFFIGLAVALQWFVPGQVVGWRAGAAFLLLAGNWWIVFQGFPSSIIFPLWSVSIEEQFYLCWPSVVRRASEKLMLRCAAAMLVVAMAARIWLGMHHTWESKIWANTFARLDPIALGVLAAVLLAGRTPQLKHWMRWALGAAGAAGILLAANYWRVKDDPLSTWRISLGYPAAALGALALLIAVLHAGDHTRPSRITRAFIYLGRISYGLYVYHVLGLMISDYVVTTHERWWNLWLLRNALAFALTLAFAAASYRWLETPFLNIKRRFTHVLSRPGG